MYFTVVKFADCEFSQLSGCVQDELAVATAASRMVVALAGCVQADANHAHGVTPAVEMTPNLNQPSRARELIYVVTQALYVDG